MASKSNLSKPDMARVIERLEDWEYLIEFYKIDFDHIPEKDLLEACRTHIVKVLLEQSSRPFTDFMVLYERYDAMKSESGFEGLREYFKDLQVCLNKEISRIQKTLLRTPGNSDKGVNTELISFRGEVRAIYNAERKRYEMRFIPNGFKVGEKIDYEMDCELLKSQYVEVLAYLLQELPSERFKLCKDKECNTPFFQATARKKSYCSEKCARKNAQAKYMEKRLKGGEKQ